MTQFGTPALFAALICFAAFFTNVALGAAGMDAFLGDVSEMLMLAAASVFFVIGVLAREASARERRD